MTLEDNTKALQKILSQIQALPNSGDTTAKEEKNVSETENIEEE